MAAVLGLDCGGSKVLARVVDGSEVVFEGRGGAANWATTPRPTIEESLKEALKGAPKVERACGCFAGLLTAQDKEEAEKLLKQATKAEKVEARPDFHAAWEVAKDNSDVLVIAGTGAIVCSESEGKVVKSGGGGILLGDEGSAMSVGRNALYAQIVSALSLPATDQFWAKVQSVFKTKEPNEILSALYKSDSPAKLLAELAQTVAQDAASEKDYAVFAVTESLVSLRDETAAHVLRYQKSKLPNVRIALTGGLWNIHPVFFEWFKPFEGEPRVKPTTRVIDVDPVAGACRLAAKL